MEKRSVQCYFLYFGLAVLIVGLVLSGLMLYYLRAKLAASDNLSLKTSTNVVDGDSVDPENCPEKTFFSKKLGISFKYCSGWNVIEKGNKVFIGFDDDELPETGQSVEVFDKNPQDSLEIAIKKQILAPYPNSACKVEADGPHTAKINLVGAVEAKLDMEAISMAVDKNCHSAGKYMSLGGENYFYAEPAHPKKFVFFDIGQYSISAHDRVWQSTLEFLN